MIRVVSTTFVAISAGEGMIEGISVFLHLIPHFDQSVSECIAGGEKEKLCSSLLMREMGSNDKK